MEKLWFKKKIHGYGLYPANWKGWTLSVLCPVCIILISLITNNTLYFALSSVIILILFIVIAIYKGEKF
jgi:uncharacterized membrane protein